MTRNSAGVITSVDEFITDMLGWRPEQLVGLPSTEFVHPEDQPSAIAAWMAMITSPGTTRVWRGRYQSADGAWTWVETVNQFEDSDDPIVSSSMRRVSVEQAGVEDELRAREQLLSRLSDALPVGLFQIDTTGRVSFTNDRLHAILGQVPGDRLLIATVERLRGALREGDDVGRLGGDEFLVICPGVENADHAIRIAERIAAATTATIDVGPGRVGLRTSIGVAWTTESLDPDAFIAQADTAMYESKRTGRHGVPLFSPAVSDPGLKPSRQPKAESRHTP
jgi:diguanylate cyclase (GGDEF)-like protein/PAS domain S-box-containing protein